MTLFDSLKAEWPDIDESGQKAASTDVYWTQKTTMTITVDLPDAAMRALDAKTGDDAVANLRLAAAMKLFELGRLSSGAAAELAGIARVEFLDRLGEFGVNAFQQTPDELDQELATLRSFRG